MNKLTCDFKDGCQREVIGRVYTIDGVDPLNYCERHIPVYEAMNRLGREFRKLGRAYLKALRIDAAAGALYRALNSMDAWIKRRRQ